MELTDRTEIDDAIYDSIVEQIPAAPPQDSDARYNQLTVQAIWRGMTEGERRQIEAWWTRAAVKTVVNQYGYSYPLRDVVYRQIVDPSLDSKVARLLAFLVERANLTEDELRSLELLDPSESLREP